MCCTVQCWAPLAFWRVFLGTSVAPFHAGMSPLEDSNSPEQAPGQAAGGKVLPLHLLVFGSWAGTDTEPTHSLFCIIVPRPLCPCTSLVLLVTYSDKRI